MRKELNFAYTQWRLLEMVGTPKKLSLINLLQNGRSIPQQLHHLVHNPALSLPTHFTRLRCSRASHLVLGAAEVEAKLADVTKLPRAPCCVH